jgi:type II secretory pathway pseudopilin PulG
VWRASASRTSPRPARARRGVSLLEAVAALAIVGATSASILATTGAGVRAAERARRAHEASALADETMARIALLSDEALRVLPDSLSGGTFAAPFDEYAWEASVQGDAQFAGLFTVLVSVQWEGGVQSTTTALYRRPVGRTGGPSVDRP